MPVVMVDSLRSRRGPRSLGDLWPAAAKFPGSPKMLPPSRAKGKQALGYSTLVQAAVVALKSFASSTLITPLTADFPLGTM